MQPKAENSAPTYKSIPIHTRLQKSLHGNVGSLTVPCVRLILRSHTTNAIHSRPETMRRVITKAERHGNEEPASSNAATKAKVAIVSIPVPIKSTLFKV